MNGATTIDLGGEQYVVLPQGEVLTIGRPAGDDVTGWTTWTWLLPAPARAAVHSGDLGAAGLRQALLSVVQAEAARGT
jgi:hypothetical protein